MPCVFDAPVTTGGQCIFDAPDVITPIPPIDETCVFDTPMHANGGCIFDVPSGTVVDRDQGGGGYGGPKRYIIPERQPTLDINQKNVLAIATLLAVYLDNE